MKKIKLLLAITILLLINNSKAQNCFNYLIFPDTTNKIILVKAVKTTNSKLLTGKQLKSNNSFANNIFKELNTPYHQSVIKLNQCSRNLSGNTKGPNVLFISENQGGFPRLGLTLIKNNETVEYPKLNYVDLVIWEDDFKYGAIDIYSHELGHVMMNNIFGTFPKYKCRKQHVSMGVTDYNIAFFEGWGIHFQRLAYDNTPLYQKGFQNLFEYDRMAKTWHSHVDENLRIEAVLKNNYIYQKQLPSNIIIDSLTTEKIIITEHTSSIFDFSKLKNPQQMLSCEGVLASLFYRINTNKKLQNNYLKKEFYKPFLLAAIPQNTQPKDIFTPFENVILKNFWVWNKIKTKNYQSLNITIEFIKEWCKSFPEDKNELIKIFLLTTKGKTINNELATLFEKLVYQGNIGNYDEFNVLIKNFEKKFSELKEKTLKDITIIEKNIGPELWIENNKIKIRTVLWNKQNKKNLYININTASIFEIASFWNMNLSKAKKFIQKRNQLGYFKSFDQAIKLGFDFK